MCFGGSGGSFGVGGFTDPEIDSIDAGKTSPAEAAKEGAETLATVLVCGVKTMMQILPLKSEYLYNDWHDWRPRSLRTNIITKEAYHSRVSRKYSIRAEASQHRVVVYDE